MTNYQNAVKTVDALVAQIIRQSNYNDLARQNAYAAGYLNTLLVKLYHESETVRNEVDHLLNQNKQEAA